MKKTVTLRNRFSGKYLLHTALLGIFSLLAVSSVAFAKAPKVVILGDSIGAGVQSGDANASTQPHSYANYLAKQMDASLSLSLIDSGPSGVVGDTLLRSRRHRNRTRNLSVSGATAGTLLYERANATHKDKINSETDLIIYPRTGSQIEVVETLKPEYTICWIGNNNVLRSVTDFDHLDGTHMTAIHKFEEDFREITRRLDAMGGKVVFANIPDVSKIGFLLNNKDLRRFLGSDHGLPDGAYTSIAAMFLIRLGLADGSILDNPDYVLDPQEVRLIQERIEIFNNIIKESADSIQMPVVDIHAILNSVAQDPPSFFGFEVTPRYLGGVFSLDGIHLSNIGGAIVANEFIETINRHFGEDYDQIDMIDMYKIFLLDPFQDKDKDTRVIGRISAGLLESLGPLLGISGDLDDFIPVATGFPDGYTDGLAFIHDYLVLQGVSLSKISKWDICDSVDAFKTILGLDKSECSTLLDGLLRNTPNQAPQNPSNHAAQIPSNYANQIPLGLAGQNTPDLTKQDLMNQKIPVKSVPKIKKPKSIKKLKKVKDVVKKPDLGGFKF